MRDRPTGRWRPFGPRHGARRAQSIGRVVRVVRCARHEPRTAHHRDELTPAFPEGATVWDAAGQWRSPDGALVRERSFVVELVHLVTADVEARVQRVMDAYKRRFAQEAVLRLVTDAWANFQEQ